MKQILLVLLFVCSMFDSSSFAKDAPDFAYPRDVNSQATADLEVALKSGNTDATINALIRMGVSQTLISPDSIIPFIGEVDKLRLKEKDPVSRALLSLLEAKAIKGYYVTNRWELDRRTSDSSVGDDLTLYSGAQLKDLVRELVMDALAEPKKLMLAMITDYPGTIEIEPLSVPLYPSVYDFIASYAIDEILFERADKMEVASNWVDMRSEISPARVSALLAQSELKSDVDYTALYNENSTTPYAIELLLKEDIDISNYLLAEKLVKDNPDYPRIKVVESRIAEFWQAKVNLSTPSMIKPGCKSKIKIEYTNATSLKIKIYRIPDRFDKYHSKLVELGNPVEVIDVAITDTLPYIGATTEVEFSVKDYGRYLALPMINGRIDDSSRLYNEIVCTDLALLSSENVANSFVVDNYSGAPIEGVKLLSRNNSTPKLPKIISDAMGRFNSVDYKGNISARLYPAKDEDRYASEQYFALGNRENPVNNKIYCGLSVKTSLPVYKPGDTVELVAVAYYSTSEVSGLLSDTEVEMTLRDANNQPLDTLKAKTDDMGRVTASFKLPDSGLTGDYSVKFSQTDESSSYILNNEYRFMVSDYKQPEFIVTLDPIAADSTNYIFSGSAITYSGFPLSDADVNIALTSLRPFFYFYSSDENDLFSRLSAKTDSNGRFLVTMPIDSMKTEARYPDGVLQMDVDVTSPSGETQSAQKSMPLSDGVSISLRGNYNDINANETKGLAIAVENVAQQIIESPIELKFISQTDTIIVGSVSKNSFAEVDFSMIPSGTYNVEIIAPKAKDSFKAKDIVIYRPDDKDSPSKKHLWMPDVDYKATVGQNPLNIIYATSSDEINVLATISVNDSVVVQWWLPKKKGMQTLALDIPKVEGRMSLTLASVYHLESAVRTINIPIVNPANELKIEVEHLRDYVTPGTEASISLKVADGNGNPCKSAAIVDVYNKSIDAIIMSNHKLGISRYVPWNYFGFEISDLRYLPSYFSSFVDKIYNPRFSQPEFNFYGYDLGYYSSYSFRSRPYLLSATPESEIVGYSESKEQKRYASAEVFDMAALEMNEAVMTEDAILDSGDNDARQGHDDSEPEISYRKAEVPLALFSPSITTDSLGRAEISFTWPDANTTWVVNALAYNNKLASTYSVSEVIASKPVMISANAPRFLRRGDKADIVVMVMNNCDSVVSANVRTSLLNPVDNSSINKPGDTIVELQPKASATLTVPVDVKVQGNAMVLKVSITADNVTDAEQHLIPILDASQPVIESDGFYLTPQDKTTTVELPAPSADSHDSTLTLTYTANPVWEVLTALPAMRQYAPVTSPTAAANLFSLAVAKGIIDDNATVVDRLGQWLRENADDTLSLSKLTANPQLKLFVLNATPWVEASASESERMARLGLMLDRESTDKALVEAVAALDKFRDKSTGGYSWGSYSSLPSTFATENVAYLLGRLRELSMLDGMESQINGAMGYLDKQLQRSVEHLGKKHFDIFFAYLCALHPDYKPSSIAKAANRRAVEYAVENWKKAPVATKALWANLLYRSGKKVEAEEILRSLNQYSTYTPAQGRFWDSLSAGTWWAATPLISTSWVLDAYNLIDSDAEEIDQIRQWMIYNKIAQGWGDSDATSSVVASVLESGSQWLTAPEDLYMTVDGKPIELNEIDRLTGSVTATLPLTGGMLRVLRSDSNPAWGAVISQYTAPMGDIKAYSHDDLSIEKQNLVLREDKWVESNEFKVGDIVKVRLIIKAKRRIDYVTVADNRAAALEPVIQTPRYVYSGSFPFYLENRDDVTNLFVDNLPKGTYIIEYEMKVNNSGCYSSGIATIQSQYAPEYTAHSSSSPINVIAK